VDHDSFSADPRLARALENRSSSIPCSEGQILFSQGERPKGLHILRTGEAALIRQTVAGKIVMCRRASAGSLLGLPAVIANEPYTLSAMVRSGSDIGFVGRNEFEELMRKEPSLYPFVLEVLAAEVRSARLALSEA
jgi:CRP-like cAMP-binding protein